MRSENSQSDGARSAAVPMWLWIYVCGVALVGCITVAQNVFDMSRQDWAAWAQAVGSIGAIIGAFEVGRRQVAADRRQALEMDRLERERKRDATVAVVQHAVSQASATVDGFKRIPTDVLLQVLRTDLYGLGAASDALFAIPLHEVGPAAAVVQFAQLQVTLRQMSRKVDQFASLDRDAALLAQHGLAGELVFAMPVAQHSADEFTKIVNSM
jgi:hypothetical protein